MAGLLAKFTNKIQNKLCELGLSNLEMAFLFNVRVQCQGGVDGLFNLKQDTDQAVMARVTKYGVYLCLQKNTCLAFNFKDQGHTYALSAVLLSKMQTKPFELGVKNGNIFHVTCCHLCGSIFQLSL